MYLFQKTYPVHHPKRLMFAVRGGFEMHTYFFTSYPRQYPYHASSFMVSYPSTCVGFNTYLLKFYVKPTANYSNECHFLLKRLTKVGINSKQPPQKKGMLIKYKKEETYATRYAKKSGWGMQLKATRILVQMKKNIPPVFFWFVFLLGVCFFLPANKAL